MSVTMNLKSNPIREVSAGKISSPSPTVNVAHISAGSYYEIDSLILPHRSPEQLKSIRVVMVSKITASDVSLRYPSSYSLRSHFDSSSMDRTKPGKSSESLLPDLDESHVIASELAGELLYRRIAPHEVSMYSNSWSFWVSAASRGNNFPRREMVSQPAYNTRLCRKASPEGRCWSELRSGGMITWGKRMRVQYQSRHIDCKKNKENSKVKKEEDDDDDGDWNESERTKKDAKETNDGTRKRKLIEHSVAKVTENQIVVYKKKPDKKFIDRWSIERYKLAEKNMLKVMKEKNAVFGNSILRSNLRSEARKLIGDTGLLDHLLKHMAGKVAPGGQDRFRRKHNADGAMEYWLESSDLVNIRKEAGVEDPYWTPPPGWKLGDNPTQDPVCAGQIREIREGLASLKRELEKLASKKEEEEIILVTTPNSCVTSQNVDHDNLMTPAKEIYVDLLKKKYKIEDQLVMIGEALRKMEEDMGWLKKTVNDKGPRNPDSTEDSPTALQTQEGEVNKENLITKSTLSLKNKTGFRIYKPEEGLSWPKMPALADATPTTDTAGFASFPSHPQSPSSSSSCPVKPLAAKRPLVLPFPFHKSLQPLKLTLETDA